MDDLSLFPPAKAVVCGFLTSPFASLLRFYIPRSFLDRGRFAACRNFPMRHVFNCALNGGYVSVVLGTRFDLLRLLNLDLFWCPLTLSTACVVDSYFIGDAQLLYRNKAKRHLPGGSPRRRGKHSALAVLLVMEF